MEKHQCKSCFGEFYWGYQEYWRRVYIQPWDDVQYNKNINGIIGKIGIKYDASNPEHIMGPYREGKGRFFFWTNLARTLPIEYWNNEEKTVRDHYLRTDSNFYHKWRVPPVTTNEDLQSFWIIPRHFWAGTDGSGHDGPVEDNPARRIAYPDKYYAYPTIEYQVLEHLKWERLPGWESRPDGDGWEKEIIIPYRVNGVIQSPFSDDSGVVYPPGTYCHGFEDKFSNQVWKYPTEDDPETPAESKIPDELKGQKVVWYVPNHFASKMDGIWVEQCLGAIVMAKAKVTIEDNFGGKKDLWVTNQQFMVTQPFFGKDQHEPV